MPSFGEKTSEIGVGDSDRVDFLHAGNNDGGAGRGDGDGRDGEFGEVLKVAEPDTGKPADAGNAGEGPEVASEICGKAGEGRNVGAIEEGEGVESGE